MTQDAAFEQAWQAHQAGDGRRAEEGYRRILQSNPRNARVWFVLGNLCADQGRLVEAAACIRQALELEPREAMGHLHLGNILLRMEKNAEAEAAYRRCLQLQPNHVEALVNLGFVLGEQDRLEEAQTCYEKARELAPHVAEIHHNLANVLREQKNLDAALAGYEEALRLRPDYAKAHINKGVALVARGDVAAAVKCLRRGVELQPDFAEAHSSLGTGLSALGRLDEAAAAYEEALRLKPDYPDAHWNRSLLWLLRGDYARGWPDYEWRWRCKKAFPLPPLTAPRWDGTPLDGRTILLYAEQGLGDTLHFVRYAPLVKTRGGRVILQCQGSLIPLLSRCSGIDELVAWGAPSPACDVWSPLMSLPALFHSTLDTIPATLPYLFADPLLVENWRKRLAELPGFKVGIVWQGSPRHAWDRHRSVPLACFEPLARIPDVYLISLQKGPGEEQIASLAGSFPLITFDQLDQHAGAFMDTAGILRNLDLVISIDTAIAHLAGGLGVPLWMPLHHVPDWRWLMHRDDNPWYPSAHLFRQPAPGDWTSVFDRIAEELRAQVPRAVRGQPLLVEISAGELLDKIAILRIKSERIRDSGKLRNVRAELAVLETVRQTLPPSSALVDLEGQLRTANERLWEIEDALREYERRQDFGPQFIELARSVYLTNDRRTALKRTINELLDSRLIEEKSYAEYADS